MRTLPFSQSNQNGKTKVTDFQINKFLHPALCFVTKPLTLHVYCTILRENVESINRIDSTRFSVESSSIRFLESIRPTLATNTLYQWCQDVANFLDASKCYTTASISSSLIQSAPITQNCRLRLLQKKVSFWIDPLFNR